MFNWAYGEHIDAAEVDISDKEISFNWEFVRRSSPTEKEFVFTHKRGGFHPGVQLTDLDGSAGIGVDAAAASVGQSGGNESPSVAAPEDEALWLLDSLTDMVDTALNHSCY